MINDKKNSMDWAVSWESIKKFASSFVGCPGILFEKCDVDSCNLDHTGGVSEADTRRKQEEYRVSTITEIIYDEVTHTAYAKQRIDSDKFYKMLQNKEVWDNLYVSPSILQEPKSGTWRGIHLSFVTNPAYGPDAKIVSME